ncbi:MAG: hypothetical protein ABID04_01015 [Patescibacteria group bacterium]
MGKKKIQTKEEKAEKKDQAVEAGSATEAKKVKKEGKKTKKGNLRVHSRSKKYQQAKEKVDSTKFYPLSEAVKLVKETSLSKFTGKLEAHLTVKKAGKLADINLPHFKGKSKKVVIADDKVIAEIEKGKLDFDVLLASPQTMPKLVSLARILGPKGLMPNPKNGTLVKDPQKAVAGFTKDTLKLKTEKKAPVAHLVVGSLDQPDKELIANLEEVVRVVTPIQIKKMVIKATMGPGVKVQI